MVVLAMFVGLVVFYRRVVVRACGAACGTKLAPAKADMGASFTAIATHSYRAASSRSRVAPFSTFADKQAWASKELPKHVSSTVRNICEWLCLSPAAWLSPTASVWCPPSCNSSRTPAI